MQQELDLHLALNQNGNTRKHGPVVLHIAVYVVVANQQCVVGAKDVARG